MPITDPVKKAEYNRQYHKSFTYIRVERELAKKVANVAKRRGKSTTGLLRDMFEIIAEDDLVDAILDDRT